MVVMGEAKEKRTSGAGNKTTAAGGGGGGGQAALTCGLEALGRLLLRHGRQQRPATGAAGGAARRLCEEGRNADGAAADLRGVCAGGFGGDGQVVLVERLGRKRRGKSEEEQNGSAAGARVCVSGCCSAGASCCWKAVPAQKQAERVLLRSEARKARNFSTHHAQNAVVAEPVPQERFLRDRGEG